MTTAARQTSPQPESAVSTTRFLYVSSTLDHCGLSSDDRLSVFTERHRAHLRIPELTPNIDPLFAVERLRADGAVLELSSGSPTLSQLRLARGVLDQGKRVWFYFPAEAAVECIDRERLAGLRKLYYFLKALEASHNGFVSVTRRVPFLLRGPLERLRQSVQDGTPEVERIIGDASPVAFDDSTLHRQGAKALSGTGVYLRTDYWAKIKAGGSYGHTCYVAEALKRTVDRLICFMPNHYSLLDELNVEQVVMPPASSLSSETNLLAANAHYYPILKNRLRGLGVEFIYERLCLGNHCGARLSQELSIPYIVEYNGSEIEMSRTFGGYTLQFEEQFLKAEEAAFKQATVISVVSDVIREDLVARGVDRGKILVNPNGVNLTAYPEPVPARREEVRRQLGWNDTHRVIGFIGTFGGWHGIDVLAEAIPLVCRRYPEARFLLIGDGNNKRMVDAQIDNHGLADRVVCMGLVPQTEGARLLQACDIYVSPHNRRMSGGRFFGSPTKIFEYMALGGGIVASDLDQIGEVLSPAIRPPAEDTAPLNVTDQRAVLCTPGNVDEFVRGIGLLVRNPELSRALGRNARRAAESEYSWDQHIAKLWDFIQQRTFASVTTRPVATETPGNSALIETDDSYKAEVQAQWDNNPCGSHYVKEAEQHTLEWYKEVEDYRYVKYAPWMPKTMEFALHRGKKLLEIGGGLGTDLAQFALNGAEVTDVDLSSGHLKLAEENFRLRGLKGTFIHQDAETLPFPDSSFDVVYSNGVIHHTPNTATLVKEMHRVLRPGGRVIVMVYAEYSLHYWHTHVYQLGLRSGMLASYSMAEIMSRNAEITENGARPLVKVYTKSRLRQMFADFGNVEIVKRQLTPAEVPPFLSWFAADTLSRFIGWNLVLKGIKRG